MKIGYDILLSLTITHPHFLIKDKEEAGGYIKGFEEFALKPDKKTAALMKGSRLTARRISNTWYLFFQTEGPLASTVDSFVNKEFLFELKINNTNFYAVTNENYLHDTGEMLWFNTSIDTVMLPQKREFYYPLKFDYTIHKQLRPVTIKVATAKGREIINKTITDTKTLVMEIDLTKEGQNIYDLSEENLQPLENEKIFASEELHVDAFYGMVFFKVLPPGNAGIANQFSINVEGNN